MSETDTPDDPKTGCQMKYCDGPREWLFQTDPTTTDQKADQTSLWMAICTDCVDDARDSFPNGHLVGHIDEFADRVIGHVFIDEFDNVR